MTRTVPISVDALTSAGAGQRGVLSRATAWIVGDRTALIGTPLRVLRLLALYRCVVAAAVAIANGALHLGSFGYAAAGAYAVWALLSVPLLGRFSGGLAGLLLAQLAIDLLLICGLFFDGRSAGVELATFLFPILAAHGWFLRNRTAIAHAAVASLAVLIAEATLRSGTVQAVTQAGLLGIGYFLLASLGLLLGRSAEESEQVAQSRGVDLRRLAHINQVVISELEDGVLAVDPTGRVLMANPQAARWLGGDEAAMLPHQELTELSPELHARWAAHTRAGFTVESSPIRSPDGARRLALRMMPVDLHTHAGTLIFLEDVEAAEGQAQQIKLAALGRLSASIAHEIRNPLSAIRQAAQLVGEEVADRPQTQTLVAMIDKNVGRIDRIVRDVSLLGRRDRGSPTVIELAPFLHELVAELCNTLPAPADAFQTVVSPGASVFADRSHLDEMLTNLVANAWRHSRKRHASVKISVEQHDEMQRALIHVVDDGSGVDPNVADRIFEPFFSASGSTGLGLFLVRELALANGGSVRVGTSSVGARFVLELPLTPTH
ncbi:MAG: PAS domain-containing protein [Burkholderiales bacterium]|nr:PAS domain-containing protein [Burkholderiales bacterium]